jgi:hypothetical protein
LTNAPGAAATVAVVSGSGQTATVATGFAQPLVAVVKDAYGNPVPDVSVTFAPPASGASATVGGSPARSDADGQASATATAGTTAGFYSVTASVAGVATEPSFGLTNAPGAAASVAVVSGSGQTATVSTGFAHPLVAVVKDAYGNPVPGVSVAFAAPASGASATLTGSPALTGADGQASVMATAGTVAGFYIVAAGAANVTSAAAFTLTNSEAHSLELTTPRDVVDQFDGLTSLREAIAYANSHPGPDTITFDPAAFGSRRRTITLQGGPLILTDPATTTIVGPGAKRLTISGGGKSQVFEIRGGSVALSGITITGGSADLGGGVCNRAGDLALSDVVIRGNRAFVGGGLFNTGRITMRGVTIRSNRALIGRNVFNTSRATLHWQRPQAAHQAKARVSIPSQERTSWIASK